MFIFVYVNILRTGNRQQKVYNINEFKTKNAVQNFEFSTNMCKRMLLFDSHDLYLITLLLPPPPPHDHSIPPQKGGGVGGGGEGGRELRPSVTNWTARQLHTWTYRAIPRCLTLKSPVEKFGSVDFVGGFHIRNRLSLCKQIKSFRKSVYKSWIGLHFFVSLQYVQCTPSWKTIRCSKEFIFFKHTFNATVSWDFSFMYCQCYERLDPVNIGSFLERYVLK